MMKHVRFRLVSQISGFVRKVTMAMVISLSAFNMTEFFGNCRRSILFSAWHNDVTYND